MPTVFLTILLLVPNLLWGFESLNYSLLQDELNQLAKLPDLISTPTVSSLPTVEATLAMDHNANEITDQVSTTNSSIQKDESTTSEPIDNRRKRKNRLSILHKK